MSTRSEVPAENFGFRCSGCGEWHTGLPAFHVAGPSNLLAIPEGERERRCLVETDGCVIDDAEFYLRALIEIPVHGAEDLFVWGVWVSVSRKSFGHWVQTFDDDLRADVGPFFGWLDTSLPLYPETRNLKARVHVRDHRRRPAVELEPTDHPLAIEQRDGISVERLAEIVAHVEGYEPPSP